MSVIPKASEIRTGKRPEFSVAVSNETDKPLRVLDVRHGRRLDLQNTYFELFVVQGRKAVEVPVVISDPGGVSAVDFFEMRPGDRVVIPHISYMRTSPGSRPAGMRHSFCCGAIPSSRLQHAVGQQWRVSRCSDRRPESNGWSRRQWNAQP